MKPVQDKKDHKNVYNTMTTTTTTTNKRVTAEAAKVKKTRRITTYIITRQKVEPDSKHTLTDNLYVYKKIYS